LEQKEKHLTISVTNNLMRFFLSCRPLGVHAPRSKPAFKSGDKENPHLGKTGGSALEYINNEGNLLR
jgi:hypothetical protein